MVDESKKSTKFRDVRGCWHLLNCRYFLWICVNSTFTDYLTEEFDRVATDFAFLPVKLAPHPNVNIVTDAIACQQVHFVFGSIKT